MYICKNKLLFFYMAKALKFACKSIKEELRSYFIAFINALSIGMYVCSDIFRGITKVTGEVDMSFATAFLQQLGSHDALVFRLTNKDNIERLQHNRNLVTLYVYICLSV